MEPLLQVAHVTICYNGKPVVQDVSFTLQKGEILGIVGESGSGKSTIIKAIMGLLGGSGMVTRGDIYYKGQNVVDMPENRLRKLLGPEMGMVFQDCKAALCPIRTVGDQIYESMSEHEKVSRAEIYRRAAEVMAKIGLSDTKRVLDSYPFELSGGMNQRVGICTAMMQHPSLLLADEPTSALDVTVQKQVVEELKLMRREYQTAMIVVTHNIGVVGVMADKVLVLQNGKVMDYGETDRVLRHSENEYTRKLMNSVLHLKRSSSSGQ
ncbi:MAG: ABC transporter ATP-binding protein [Candidatus Limivivens sp.]|nr:ABC transporter ATP-binding protein [Candidatus Limivivens sp.]